MKLCRIWKVENKGNRTENAAYPSYPYGKLDGLSFLRLFAGQILLKPHTDLRAFRNRHLGSLNTNWKQAEQSESYGKFSWTLS